MRRKYILTAVLCVLGLALIMAGCQCLPVTRPEPEPEPEPSGFIEGYITDGQGGPAVEGVTVTSTINGTVYETNTDGEGYFLLEVSADTIFDLLLMKTGRGTVRVQNLNVPEADTITLYIPSQPIFNPQWSDTPPVIEANVNPGDELTGTFSLDLSVSGEHSTFVYYVYLGGLQRAPRVDYQLSQDSGTVDIDTTLYPNGPTYVRVLAYDINNNAAMLIVPVNIDNPNTTVGEIPYLGVEAYTFGQNIRLYSENREAALQRLGIKEDPNIIKITNEIEFDLRSAPEGATMLTYLLWLPASNARGYSVYRSLDGVNYSHAGNVPVAEFIDTSPLLAADVEVFYKVAPYNEAGEGEPIYGSTTPLPSFNVYLEEPANEAVNVPLTPVFSWRNEIDGEFPQDIVYNTGVSLYNGTDYLDWYVSGVTETETTYPGTLQPGYVYSWDVYYSYAYKLYDDESDGYSVGVSVSGEYDGTFLGSAMGTGSVNGEFVFTTTTEQDPE